MAEQSLGRELAKELQDISATIKKSAVEIGHKIGHEVDEVLGDDIVKLKEYMKDVGEKIWDITKRMAKPFTIFGRHGIKQFDLLKKQQKDIEEINERQKRQEKRELAKTKGKGILQKLMDTVFFPLFVLGAALGGLVGTTLLPFILILKEIALWAPKLSVMLNALKAFGNFLLGFNSLNYIWLRAGEYLQKFKSMKIGKILIGFFQLLGKAGRFITKVMGVIWKGIAWGGRMLAKFPIIRQFIKGFVWGFKKFMFPLQVLLSLFDFVTGFMGTKGDIIDKIKGGLSNAVIKFVELPVKFFEWVWNKLTGRTDNISSTVFKFINDMIGFVIDFVMGFITKTLPDLIKKDIALLKKIAGGFGKLIDIFKGVMSSLWGWLKEIILKVNDFLPQWARNSLMLPEKETIKRWLQEDEDAIGTKEAIKKLKEREQMEKEKLAVAKEGNQWLKQTAEYIKKRREPHIYQQQNNTQTGAGGKITPGDNEDTATAYIAGGGVGL